jgi:hypothetical protein
MTGSPLHISPIGIRATKILFTLILKHAIFPTLIPILFWLPESNFFFIIMQALIRCGWSSGFSKWGQISVKDRKQLYMLLPFILSLPFILTGQRWLFQITSVSMNPSSSA